MNSRGRYTVTSLVTAERSKWIIYDTRLSAMCTLPDTDGYLLPLEWDNRPAAEAYLFSCFIAWACGTAPAPTGWKPVHHPWA